MMNNILQTDLFAEWLKKLKDLKAKARILVRINLAEKGNFGDARPVGEGVSEMRIDVGSGYRVYFMKQGNYIYILLCGGDKTTQQKDIDRAKALAKMLKERGEP